MPIARSSVMASARRSSESQCIPETIPDTADPTSSRSMIGGSSSRALDGDRGAVAVDGEVWVTVHARVVYLACSGHTGHGPHDRGALPADCGRHAAHPAHGRTRPGTGSSTAPLTGDQRP